MMVRKLTATWGSKGMGAEVSIWMPDATFQTYEMLSSGKRADEILRIVVDTIRGTVNLIYPLAPPNRKDEIEVKMETYDDETGERLE